MPETLRVLFVGAPAPPGQSAGLVIEAAAAWPDALELLAGGASFDVIVIVTDGVQPVPADVADIARHGAVVVVTADPDSEHALRWLRCGAQDVLTRDELAGAAASRRLRFAGARRFASRSLGRAYATDLATGLPHRQQLIEHLSQLLALREREPAPMAVLALRIEAQRLSAGASGDDGAAQTESLRRKIAVRLRAGVRASDVVASLGDEGFAVLLGSMLAPEDAERVAAKLVGALCLPFALASGERRVSVAAGIGRYPQDGRDAERLLRRALALAAVAPATSAAGASTAHDAVGTPRVAANDDR